MRKRVSLLVLVVFTLASIFSTISMAEGGNSGISPRFTYTWSVGSGLQISSSGVAECHGNVKVYDDNSTISIKVSLYQRVGNSWDRITSWYGTATGTPSYTLERYYQLTEYGTYKVLVTGTVTGVDGGQEWLSLESNHMTYP